MDIKFDKLRFITEFEVALSKFPNHPLHQYKPT